MEENKAVVIGVNYYTGLSTLRSLGRNGIYVVACEYDDRAYGLKSKYINEVLRIPDVKQNSQEAFKILIEYGKAQKRKPVLLPTHDNYVALVDKYLLELSEYYLIPQHVKGIYTKVMYKNSLSVLAKKYSAIMPLYVEVSPHVDYKYIKTKIKYPCIVKPDNSSAFVKQFKKKVIVCKNEEDLKSAIVTMQKNSLMGKIEEIIPGFDDHMYTYDAFVSQEGKVTHDVTMQKLRQYPINFGASVYIHQINVPEIREIGRKFLEDIAWRGFAEIEFKKREGTKEYYIIEINTRMTNFNALLEELGLNMPLLTYMDLTGQNIGEKHITDSTDIAFRYFFDDLAAIKNYKKRGQLTHSEIRKNNGKKTVGAIWAWDDMIPAIYYFFEKIRLHFHR